MSDTVHGQGLGINTQCGRQYVGVGYRPLLKTLPVTLLGSTGGITCKACLRVMEKARKAKVGA